MIAFATINRRGIGDLDSWWHVKIGDQIRAGVPFNDLGNSWSLYSGKWQTSQWLSEWLMSISHQMFGWEGLLWWRLIFGLLLLVVFISSIARRNGISAVVITSLISAFVLVPSIQERPALIGLIFTTALGARCRTILLEKRLPPSTWFWIPLTTFWANFHGSWILAPTALALACALSLLDLRSRGFALRSVLLILAVTVAGCLTPVGWQGLLLPFKLQSTAGKFITEWQRTTLYDPLVYGLLALLAIMIYIWARGNVRPSRRELLWVLAWTIFAGTAFRNVGPALLFVAPIAAHRIDQWFQALAISERRIQNPSNEGFRTPAFLLSVAVAIGIATFSTSILDPFKSVTPLRIAQRLAQSSSELRIINDYNASGVLLAIGGNRVHLAVDGRADRFDPNWLARYFAMLKESNTNYYLLDQLKPNVAVIDAGSPLIWWLIENEHWSRVLADGRYVLVTAPTINLGR